MLIRQAAQSYYRQWTPDIEERRALIVTRLRRNYEGKGILNKGVCPFPEEQLALFTAEVHPIKLDCTKDDLFSNVRKAVTVFNRIVATLPVVV